MPKLRSSGAARRPKPIQNIGKASSYSKPAPRKAAPLRSNAGGALRGQARAAQVKAMNAAKPKPSQAKAAKPQAPKGPTHGNKVSAESRLAARGRVKGPGGGIYFKSGPKAGTLVNAPKAQPAAAKTSQSRGASPLDLFGGAGLMNRNTQAIKRAVSRR